MIRPLLLSMMLAGLALMLICAAGWDYRYETVVNLSDRDAFQRDASNTNVPKKRGPRLMILCAAGLAPMMEDLASAFEKETGCTVAATYQGSAELVSLYQIQSIGDLLIAADTDYHKPLVEKGRCDPPVILGQQFPCLIVHRSVTGSITPADLTSGAYRTSIPKRAHAAIGRAVARVVGNDAYDRYSDASTVSRETVAQVGGDVDQKFVDLGIAWSTTSANFPNARTVDVDDWSSASSQIGISVLSTSANEPTARRFVQFLQSSAAAKITAAFGYRKTETTPSSFSQGAAR